MKELAKCIDCGRERLVRTKDGIPIHERCCKCSNKLKAMIGEDNPNWKGGRIKHDGYVMIRVYPKDKFYCMVESESFPYVMEHRLLMAEYLDRPLILSEKVHHDNEIRDDNRIENFELTDNGGHAVTHNLGHHPKVNRIPPNNIGKRYSK